MERREHVKGGAVAPPGKALRAAEVAGSLGPQHVNGGNMLLFLLQYLSHSMYLHRAPAMSQRVLKSGEYSKVSNTSMAPVLLELLV